MTNLEKLTRLDEIAWSVVVDGQYDVVFVPTRHFVDTLTDGSIAPNCFGRLSRVQRVTYRGERQRDGAHYVGYYTPLGDSGQVSNSVTEGEILRGSRYSWTSKQFDAVEQAIRNEASRG